MIAALSDARLSTFQSTCNKAMAAEAAYVRFVLHHFGALRALLLVSDRQVLRGRRTKWLHKQDMNYCHNKQQCSVYPPADETAAFVLSDGRRYQSQNGAHNKKRHLMLLAENPAAIVYRPVAARYARFLNGVN